MNSSPFEEVAIALDHAHGMAREFVLSLPHRPAGPNTTLDEMQRAFDESLPETGRPATEALDDWFRRAEAGIVASAGLRYFGSWRAAPPPRRWPETRWPLHSTRWRACG